MTLKLPRQHFWKSKCCLSSLSAFTSFGLYGFGRLRVHFSYRQRHFFLPCEEPHFLLKLLHLLSINRTYDLWQKFWLERMSGGHHVQAPEAALPFYHVDYGFVWLSLTNLQGQRFYNLPEYPVLSATKAGSFFWHPSQPQSMDVPPCYQLTVPKLWLVSFV